MSSTTEGIDYSLRQNKTIERLIVFDGLRSVVNRLELKNLVYVGFGSVWFSDFHLAHKTLAIQTMISIEADDVTYLRAKYNAPYRTVEVEHGWSSAVLPKLVDRGDLADRPWVVWLDYDNELDEGKLQELSDLIRDCPPDSFIITTFPAAAGSFGAPINRAAAVEQMFGDAAPPEPLPLSDYKGDAMAPVLRGCVQRYLGNQAVTYGRGFVPTFSLCYRDGTAMVTVGGFVASGASQATVEAMVADVSWAGTPAGVIQTPPLTERELHALLQLLPPEEKTVVTREQLVDKLGFDLKQEQLDSFQSQYLRYPSFAQISR